MGIYAMMRKDRKARQILSFHLLMALSSHSYVFIINFVCFSHSSVFFCVFMFRKLRGLPRWKLEPGLQMPQWMNGFRYAVDAESLY